MNVLPKNRRFGGQISGVKHFIKHLLMRAMLFSSQNQRVKRASKSYSNIPNNYLALDDMEKF